MIGTIIEEVSRRFREVLDSQEGSEDREIRVALRRQLRECVTGLPVEEIAELVSQLELRFPDPVSEDNVRIRTLQLELEQAHNELEELRKEKRDVDQRLAELESLTVGLFNVASDDKTEAGARLSQEAMFRVLQTVLSAVIVQDRLAREMSELRISALREEKRELADIFAEVVQGKEGWETLLQRLERRLRIITHLPTATLAGSDQSWTTGMTELLESLNVEGILQEDAKLLNATRNLRKVKERWQECCDRDQLDRNVYHYFRRCFENVADEYFKREVR